MAKLCPYGLKILKKNNEKKPKEPFLSQQEKNIIKTDLQNLKSMEIDRVASYTSLDKTNISRIENCKLKERKEISELSCSSVMTSQEISDIPLGDSCISDLEVASFTELPKKRPHKRIFKRIYRCITVFTC